MNASIYRKNPITKFTAVLLTIQMIFFAIPAVPANAYFESLALDESTDGVLATSDFNTGPLGDSENQIDGSLDFLNPEDVTPISIVTNTLNDGDVDADVTPDTEISRYTLSSSATQSATYTQTVTNTSYTDMRSQFFAMTAQTGADIIYYTSGDKIVSTGFEGDPYAANEGDPNDLNYGRYSFTVGGTEFTIGEIFTGAVNEVVIGAAYALGDLMVRAIFAITDENTITFNVMDVTSYTATQTESGTDVDPYADISYTTSENNTSVLTESQVQVAIDEGTDDGDFMLITKDSAGKITAIRIFTEDYVLKRLLEGDDMRIDPDTGDITGIKKITIYDTDGNVTSVSEGDNIQIINGTVTTTTTTTSSTTTNTVTITDTVTITADDPPLITYTYFTNFTDDTAGTLYLDPQDGTYPAYQVLPGDVLSDSRCDVDYDTICSAYHSELGTTLSFVIPNTTGVYPVEPESVSIFATYLVRAADGETGDLYAVNFDGTLFARGTVTIPVVITGTNTNTVVVVDTVTDTGGGTGIVTDGEASYPDPGTNTEPELRVDKATVLAWVAGELTAENVYNRISSALAAQAAALTPVSTESIVPKSGYVYDSRRTFDVALELLNQTSAAVDAGEAILPVVVFVDEFIEAMFEPFASLSMEVLGAVLWNGAKVLIGGSADQITLSKEVQDFLRANSLLTWHTHPLAQVASDGGLQPSDIDKRNHGPGTSAEYVIALTPDYAGLDIVKYDGTYSESSTITDLLAAIELAENQGLATVTDENAAEAATNLAAHELLIRMTGEELSVYRAAGDEEINLNDLDRETLASLIIPYMPEEAVPLLYAMFEITGSTTFSQSNANTKIDYLFANLRKADGPDFNGNGFTDVDDVLFALNAFGKLSGGVDADLSNNYQVILDDIENKTGLNFDKKSDRLTAAQAAQAHRINLTAESFYSFGDNNGIVSLYEEILFVELLKTKYEINPADFNLDGYVDDRDYQILLENQGQEGIFTFINGNSNIFKMGLGDTFVGGSDFDVYLNNAGQGGAEDVKKIIDFADAWAAGIRDANGDGLVARAEDSVEFLRELFFLVVWSERYGDLTEQQRATNYEALRASSPAAFALMDFDSSGTIDGYDWTKFRDAIAAVEKDLNDQAAGADMVMSLVSQSFNDGESRFVLDIPEFVSVPLQHMLYFEEGSGAVSRGVTTINPGGAEQYEIYGTLTAGVQYATVLVRNIQTGEILGRLVVDVETTTQLAPTDMELDSVTTSLATNNDVTSVTAGLNIANFDTDEYEIQADFGEGPVNTFSVNFSRYVNDLVFVTTYAAPWQDTVTFSLVRKMDGVVLNTVNVDFSHPNYSPRVASRFENIEVNGVLELAAWRLASDVEGDAYEVTAVTQPISGISEILANGNIRYTPDADFTGIDVFSQTICEIIETESCTTGVIRVQVGDSEVYSVPPINIESMTGMINPDGSINLDIVTDAPMSNNITTHYWTILDFGRGPLTAWDGQNSLDAKTLELRNLEIPEGADRVTFRIVKYQDFNEILAEYTLYIDGSVISAEPPVINESDPVPDPVINDPNSVGSQSPTAVDDYAVTATNKSILVNVLENDTDPDTEAGDILRLERVVTKSETGAASIVDGAIHFEPALDFTGYAMIYYEVCDSSNACDMALLRVTVKPPIVVEDEHIMVRGSRYRLAVMDNDEGEGLYLKSVGLNSEEWDSPRILRGRSERGGYVHYTDSTDVHIVTYYPPRTGHPLTDSYTYEVCNADNICETSTVYIDYINYEGVAPQPDSASMEPNIFGGLINGVTPQMRSLVVDVTANDVSLDGYPEPDPLFVHSYRVTTTTWRLTQDTINLGRFVTVQYGRNRGIGGLGDGQIRVIPQWGWEGLVEIEYQVCDNPVQGRVPSGGIGGPGLCTWSTLTVTVGEPAPIPAPADPPKPYVRINGWIVEIHIPYPEGFMQADDRKISLERRIDGRCASYTAGDCGRAYPQVGNVGRNNEFVQSFDMTVGSGNNILNYEFTWTDRDGNPMTAVFSFEVYMHYSSYYSP